MTRKRFFSGSAVFFFTISFIAPSFAVMDDFEMIVQNVEKHYQAKRKKIPLLGIANLASKVIQPSGVKSFKIAVFEEQDFAPGQRDQEFYSEITHSLDAKWKPLVRSGSRGSGTRTFSYSREAGPDLELLAVTLTSTEAIITKARLSPDAVAKFMDRPELLGLSLAGGSSRLSTGADTTEPTIGGKGDGRRSSLQALRDPNLSGQAAADSGTKPTLHRTSPDDPEPDTHASSDPAADKTSSDETTLHLEARLVNLNVKVCDHAGALLGGLDKQDFKVFEDGIEQHIFYFEPITAPINLVLLLDLSGSTQDSRKVMIETARRFIDSLGTQDRIALAAFTRDFVVLSDFTSDKKHLREAVAKVKGIEGGTAFYDGMWSAMDLLRKVKGPRKAVVVLTDGVDNSLLKAGYFPSRHGFEQLLGRVTEEDATIYPIYLSDEEMRLRRELTDRSNDDRQRGRIGRRLQTNLLARRQIEKLAEESAGTVFVAEQERDLDGVYQRVAAELRVVYTIAYAPKNDDRDGKYRKLNVTVNHDDAVVVKTRRGYYAK
ncbi:MAG: hypothetical protein DMF61_05415 [Blastocatellia bacterium AA13]|nr:MAG: hypothetical protein DMF61_05415 [Blastocatellia bacterium AA13]